MEGWKDAFVYEDMKNALRNLIGLTLCSYFPAGLDFEALLIKPKEIEDGVKLPLIVIPHGWFLSFWFSSHYYFYSAN